MGTRNKERRRVKKSARSKAARREVPARQGQRRATPPGTGAYSASPSRSDMERAFVADLIYRAAHSSCDGQPDDGHFLDLLTKTGSDPYSRRLVTSELKRAIREGAGDNLLNGWEPIDLWQASRRIGGASVAALLAGLEEVAVRLVTGRQLEAWLHQCEGIPARRLDPGCTSWADDVRSAVLLVGILDHLPPLRQLHFAPAPTHRTDNPQLSQLLSRIRALLAKAESTEFAEEADSFTAKANELMTRHRIDRAALEASSGVSEVHGVVARRVWIDAPYADQKAFLLQTVAGESGCRSVSDPMGFDTLVGDGADVEMTELLYTSLLVQATTQMTAVGKSTAADLARARERVASLIDDRMGAQRDHDVDEAAARLGDFFARRSVKTKRNPGFRRSFLTAYAVRIGTRLREAAGSATAAAEAELGGAFLPVLARRQRLVDDAVDKMFGELSHSAMRAGDRAGWIAGTAAADLADLNARAQLSRR